MAGVCTVTARLFEADPALVKSRGKRQALSAVYARFEQHLHELQEQLSSL